jgi:DNA mismatch repair protein MutL
LSGAAALMREAESALAEAATPWDDASPIVTPALPALRLIGQVGARLLLLEGEAGLYLVDQHRAHERILYERMRAAQASGEGPLPEPIALREPLLVEVAPPQAAALERRLGDLRALGFALEEFGGHAFLLRSAPSLPGVLSGGDGSPALADLADPSRLAESLALAADDAERERAGDGETWQERLLVRLSCRAAVRRGQALERPAMRALVEGLGQTAAPAVCPHGSPLLMHVTAEALERQFGW